MLQFAAVVDTTIGKPLARFELIHLPQGSLLSVSMSHSITDGYGYFFFLMSWAATARGASLPEPSHERAGCGRSTCHSGTFQGNGCP
jgi:hypothetical protein